MADKKIRTMLEFCQAIGLSRPTVSRYFNNPELVRKSSREIIEKGLDKYDYNPNFHAASLHRSTSKALGVIVPSIVDPFFSALVTSIEKFAEERGYVTILQCSHNDPHMEVRALRLLQSMNLVGIAMSPLGASSDIAAVDKAQSSIRIVFMDSRLSTDTPYIGTDNRKSLTKLVGYLCETGTPPVLIAMSPINFNITERHAQFCTQMEERGHQPVILNPGSFSESTDLMAFEQFGMEQFMAIPREKLPHGTTILCLNDRVAFGVLAGARKRHLNVGKGPESDLRVAGHDNQFFSQFTAPSLTTVGQDAEKIGILAAKALLDPDNNADLLNNGCLLESELFIRDSA